MGGWQVGESGPGSCKAKGGDSETTSELGFGVSWVSLCWCTVRKPSLKHDLFIMLFGVSLMSKGIEVMLSASKLW
jgi:hypothetical protein